MNCTEKALTNGGLSMKEQTVSPLKISHLVFNELSCTCYANSM